MSDVFHELTMLYMKNSINLSDLKEPSQYSEAYFKAYSEIRSKYAELHPKKDSSRSKGSRKVISKGI